MWRSVWIIVWAMSFVASGLRAQEATPKVGAAEASVADQRIAFLREKMERLRLRSSDSPQTKFPLHEKLALRWSNPVSGVVDGGVYIWTDGRRPVVIGKAFLNDKRGPQDAPGGWCEALQSVTAIPFVMQADGQEIWKPANPGPRFHDLGESEGLPSENDNARLTQMRGLARKIQVIGNWGTPPSDWQLRTLTTPLFRYASEPDGIVDGAVFAYTQGGTNPEAIALIAKTKSLLSSRTSTSGSTPSRSIQSASC